MVGKELEKSKGPAVNLRDAAMRQSLRMFHQKGHCYVELRQSGKRMIFFCTLCLAPCYSDNALSDHLNGNLHAQRLSAAKLTLFGPTPWPFSDGVLFFDTSEKEPFSPLPDSHNSKSLVIHEQNSDKEDEISSMSGVVSNRRALDVRVGYNESEEGLTIIPMVLVNEQIMGLRVRRLGAGQIAYRIRETKEGESVITRMWCAWLGQGEYKHESGLRAPVTCDFAVVNFPYAYGLGRCTANDDEESPASPSSFFEIDDSGCRMKKKKSSSEPEDSSESLSEHCTNPRSIAADDTEQLDMRLIPSKTARRELRKRKRLASERICDICGQPMLPGKDVATLLNCKTGRLACSSRNVHGAFHPFHASCLIHWILLCELELFTNPVPASNTKPRRGRRAKPKHRDGISSVFCPECQGTGICIEGEELEKPTIPLSQTFLYKLKAIDANKAWMKDPEVLQNCSTGLHFPSKLVATEEKIMPMKLLQFFRVAE